MDDTVEVHLLIRQANEDLTVDFPFNKQTDDLDVVVGDLLDTLGMPESEKPRFRELIENQIYGSSGTASQPGAFEPIGADANGPSAFADDYQSDDADITDSEYRLLLEEQRQQMEALLSQHAEERRELAARLRSGQAGTPAEPQSLPLAPTIGILPQPAPSIGPVVPVLIPQGNPDTCDDLIVF
jgi:hypothetical protein